MLFQTCAPSGSAEGEPIYVLASTANGKYDPNSIGGTSAAAPMVSGVVGLVWSIDSSLSASKVKEIVCSNYNCRVVGHDQSVGEIYPMLNARLAVEAAISGSDRFITGTAMSSDTDKPIEGATAYLNCIFGEAGADIGSATTTASDGTFKLTIPENATAVTGIQFEKDGYSSYLFPLVADVNSSFDIGTVRLTPIAVDPIITPAISGTVKDASTGLVLENVDIYVYDENGYGPYFTGKTSSDGTFSITLEENGVYNLKFIKEGYEENVLNNTIVTSGTALVGTILLTPKVSSDDIIYISTPEQFNAIRNNLSAHYVLVNDIDLSSFTTWAPIGTSDNPFSGILDGNGHSINGFTISSFDSLDLSEELSSKDDTGYCGAAIFGTVSNGAVIQNLNVNDVSIRYEMGYQLTCYGVLVGKLFNASVENCSVSGSMDISTPGCYVGGIVGYGSGTIRNCTNNCDITISAILNSCNTCFVGGILGSGGVNNVEHCYNAGKINTTIRVISQSWAATTGIAETTGVGGIIGFGIVKNCANAATSLQLTANMATGKCGRISGVLLSGGNINCASFADTLVNGQFVNSSDLTSIHGKDIATIDEVNNWYQNL